MDKGDIVINRDYQRSPKVWPPAARSYLIDTVLSGYPIPKISLYQKTDLKSRRTIKEIVDGQQRSAAIRAFFANELRMSGKSAFSGRTYSQLEEADQQKFVDYTLSVDIFIGAVEADIRQVFRRINSYTVPLNPQEKRHATFQGALKWFIVDQSELYAQTLKDMGVLTEMQLSRMNDAALLTDICLTMLEGIQSASEAKLEALYKSRDEDFPEKDNLAARIKDAISWIQVWEPIHGTGLMKPYNFYSLVLAISHTLHPLPALSKLVPQEKQKRFKNDIVLANLSHLADALDEPKRHQDVAPFIQACEKATNRINQRNARFDWFCRALRPQLIDETN